MNQDSAESRFVSEVLTPYVQHLEPRPGLYDTVLRRHHRRRAGLVAAGVAGVVAATAVPVAITRHHPGGGTGAPPGSTGSPAGEHVRGSLRGDRALIDQARALCASQPLHQEPPGSMPSNVRVQVAERLGQDTVVMAYGTAPGGEGVVECTVGRTGSGPLRWLGGSSYTSTEPASDGRLAQRFYGADPIRVEAVAGLSRPLLLIVAPPDASAELQNGYTITAQPRLVPDNRPVPLHDGGVALVAAPAGQAVTISRAGRKVAQSAGDPSPNARVRPSGAELAAMVADGRGTINADLLEYFVSDLTLLRLGQVQREFSCLWGGKLPRGNDDVVVCAATFPSGASYVWEATSGHYYSLQSLLGLVPAGAVEHRVLSFKQAAAPGTAGTAALVVVCPPNATRAEATLANGDVVPVPLHEGGGAIDWPGTVTQVTAYDATNHVIDRRPVADGVLKPGI